MEDSKIQMFSIQVRDIVNNDIPKLTAGMNDFAKSVEKSNVKLRETIKALNANRLFK